MVEANITVHGTPNPNAAKFTVDRTLVEGGSSKSYLDAASAAGDPLASQLFGIDGVQSLLIADDFVTVTKDPSASWDALIPIVQETIQRFLSKPSE